MELKELKAWAEVCFALLLGPAFELVLRLVRRWWPADVKPSSGAREHVVYFDVWRSICVALVVITHSHETYAEWNVMAVQQWVLPYLELIAGTLAAVSRKPLPEFVSRLLLYTSFGSCLNFMGMLLGGKTWWLNTMFQVTFQMGFTMQLAFYAVLGDLLRRALAEPRVPSALLGMAAAVLLLAIGWCWSDADAFRVLLPLLFSVLHVLLLCLGGCFPGHQDLLGHVSWLLLYGTRLGVRLPRPMGPELHLGDLFLLAYVVKLVPLRGQEDLGKYMLLFWPFLPMLVGLLLVPGTRGRKDQDPWDSAWGRGRMYAAEWVAVMGFLCIPKAKDVKGVAFPRTWVPHLSWLSWWALWAFVSHKGLYYVLEGRVPWFLLPLSVYAQALPFYLWFRPRLATQRQEEPGQEMT